MGAHLELDSRGIFVSRACVRPPQVATRPDPRSLNRVVLIGEPNDLFDRPRRRARGGRLNTVRVPALAVCNPDGPTLARGLSRKAGIVRDSERSGMPGRIFATRRQIKFV